MVKHTQTIRRPLPTNCLSVFDHFVGLVFKGLRLLKKGLAQKVSKALVPKVEILYHITLKHLKTLIYSKRLSTGLKLIVNV